jgi:hypothetical protein
MRAVILVCGLVACGGGSNAKPDAPIVTEDAAVDANACVGPPGMVTVRTKIGYTVVFHDPSGAIVKSMVTTSATTSEMLAPCSMVTVAKPKGVVTITDVMPGETIVVGVATPVFSDMRGLQITFPTNGTQREFRTAVPGCGFLAQNSPVTLQIPAQCRNAGTGNIDMIVLDRAAGSGEIVGFETISIAPGAAGITVSTTIAAFRTDFASTFIDVTSTPTGLTRTASVRTLIDGMDPDVVFSSTSLPANIKIVPGARAIRIAGATSGDETLSGFDVVPQPLDAIYQFDIATEVPYRITNVDATGSPPTATWTTTGSRTNVDMAIACLEWFDAGEYEWCIYVDPARTSVKFPSVPPSIIPTTPHETHGAALVETSVFDGWGTAHRDALNRFGVTGGLRYPQNLRVRTSIRHPALYEIWEL